MRIYFPHASDEVISFIANELYPAVYDGSQPYTTPFARLDLLISEMMVSCNSRWLTTGLGVDRTYNYLFSVPPGFHMDDIPYTFFGGAGNAAVKNETLAETMQRYIVAFIAEGDPGAFQAQTGAAFPVTVYGSDSEVTNFNTTVIDVQKDPNDNARCAWWQQGLFL